jgi:hypothetical protein
MTAAYDASDWQAFGECFHDDAVLESMGQRVEGRDAIVEYQRSNTPEVERRDWYVADDERVWGRWTASFDADDGRRITTTGASMSQVRDGRVTHLAMWVDLSFMLPAPD